MNHLEVYILYQDQGLAPDEDTQKRLGSFLRRKREGLSPEDIGLTRPPRRRTPGLRREDVAAMAGISTVWYSKIERGQAIGISREALQAISRVLRLQPPEHRYLMTLAKQPTPSTSTPCLMIGSHTRRLLDRIDPMPAIVTNDYYDILAANRAYSLMCGIDLDAVPPRERNYIGLAFSSPAWRRFLRMDDVEVGNIKLARMVGSLRGISANRPGDSLMSARIRELKAQSKEFSSLWDSEVVNQSEASDHALLHAKLGPIILRKQIWQSIGGETSGRLNVYNPLNDEDCRRLEDIYASWNGGSEEN